MEDLLLGEKSKKNALIFKVDFDKAFDSLSWEFLDSVMEQMNFRWKWRRWIKGCLESSMASILVNGTPHRNTLSREELDKEILFQHSFLLLQWKVSILLCMRLVICIILEVFLSLTTTFLFLTSCFPKMLTFMGEWSKINFLNLNRLLRCFFLASGLKVNLNKSKVCGIGVDDLEIERLANILKCEPDSFPFTYLGLPVGANMKLSRYWNPIIEKFRCKLYLCTTRKKGFCD
uniref:Reverse transcriptase domain-containing protein n=1 Tax=Lactuca sativa TaxID=4236 RepID=A0A9R1VSJ7_LACSA|nr:hypothetical protein LSAT_V11C400165120 [Lactuca sativa]